MAIIDSIPNVVGNSQDRFSSGQTNGLNFAIGLIGAAQKIKNDRLSLLEAKEKKAREDEEWGFKKQEYQLKLDQLKAQGKINDMVYSQFSKQIADEGKLKDAQSTVNDNMIFIAEEKNKQEATQLGKVASIIMPAIASQREEEIPDEEEQNFGLELAYSPTRGGYIRQKKSKSPAKENANLGDVLAGIDEMDPDSDPKEAERIALKGLGTKWATEYPDIQKTIKAKFGPSELPGNITKTSEAVRFLMLKYGMDEASARDWVKRKQGQ